MKWYRVYHAGGEAIGCVMATCITKAAKGYISTLERPAKYEIDSPGMAGIRYADNYNVMGDYVIVEA